MQLTEEPIDEIRDLFPKPRGNVRWGSSAGAERNSLRFATRLPLAQSAGVLWALEHGVRPDGRCWAECGVLAAVFKRWRDRGLVASGTEIAMLDSTSVKAHVNGTGGLKKWFAKYRTLARRVDDQSSSTGVGRALGMEFLALPLGIGMMLP